MCLFVSIFGLMMIVVLHYLPQKVSARCAIPPDSNGHVTINDVPSVEANAFKECNELKSLLIGDNVSRIYAEAFYNAGNLRSVVIGDGVSAIGPNAFSRCYVLTEVVLGKSVRNIHSSAFERDLELKEINFPDGLQEINSNAFRQTGLRSINIPASILKISTMSFAWTLAREVTIGASDVTLVIGPQAFAYNKDLLNVTFLSRETFFVGGTDPVSGCDKLKRFRFPRSARVIDGLSIKGFECTSTAADGADRRNASRCGCAKGYENLLPASSSLFSCSPCLPGFTNTIPLSQGLCQMCTEGFYSSEPGSNFCEQCPKGKYSTSLMQISESFCLDCDVGKYAPATGSSTCLKCPSGSACPSNGTSEYTLCDRGEYNSYQGKTECLSCPSGRYGPHEGAAVCEGCPKGRYYGGTGANNVSYCLECPPGRYGDKEGLSNCSVCPTGQYQPSEGEQRCKECVDLAAYKTNNAEHTGCVDNEDLLGDSVVEMLFKNYTAYYVSFTVGILFMGFSAAMHYLRRSYIHIHSSTGDDLGQLQPWQVLYKSALPGLSFGSEITLMIAIFFERPPLAITMLIFRLLHVLATGFVVACLLSSIGENHYVNSVFPEVSEWRKMFSFHFAKANIPIVSAILLLCACDVSLVQMLPWNNTSFYNESVGYPSKSMMRFAVGVDLLQAGVSVICTITYLAGTMATNDAKDPTTTAEARSLFALNITISLLTLTASFVVLFLKDRLLQSHANKTAVGIGEAPGGEVHPPGGEVHPPPASLQTSHRSSATIELGGLYSDKDCPNDYSNPMHRGAGGGLISGEGKDSMEHGAPRRSSVRKATAEWQGEGELRERVAALEREVTEERERGKEKDARIAELIRDRNELEVDTVEKGVNDL